MKITNSIKIVRFQSIKTQKQKTLAVNSKGLQKKAATYSSTGAVPSALTGLTSLFGKVRGEPQRNNHLKFLVFSSQFIVYSFKNS